MDKKNKTNKKPASVPVLKVPNIATFTSSQLFRLYCRKMSITDEEQVNAIWKQTWGTYGTEEDVVLYLYSLVYNEQLPVPDTKVRNYNASDDTNKYVIRNLVDSYYDIQKLRISTGNRVCASFKTQLGQDPGKSEETLDGDAVKILSAVRKEYDRIADGMIENKLTIKKAIEMLSNDPEPLRYIKSKTDYDLIESYNHLVDAEAKTADSVASVVKKHPMWNEFFSKVKGCGPMMAGVCISYLDINKARYASSFMAYAGIDPVVVTKYDENGEPYQVSEGHGLKHVREEIYLKADETWGVKNSIGYNPKLKSMLLSTLADGFLKAGYRREKDENGNAVEGGWIKAEGYARAYTEYMHRLDHRNDRERTKGHKHLMAKRYMIKCFLKDMWFVWRTIAGYDAGQPYEIEFLGKDPHHYNRFYELPQKTYKTVADYTYLED